MRRPRYMGCTHDESVISIGPAIENKDWKNGWVRNKKE